MKFDQFTIGLLILRADRPQFDEEAADALQDAHLAFLDDLHKSGALLAAGPLLGEAERELRGVCLFNVEARRAVEMMQEDPEVKTGRLSFRAFPWMVPAGAMHFTPTRFPRSIREADEK